MASGRKLPVERVRELAKGRVWTGEEALKIGLVDQLGGFTDAVEAAKAQAGIKGAVRLKVMPPRLSLFEALQQAMGVSANNARTLAAAGWLLGDPRAKAVIDEMMQARLRGQGANALGPKPFH